MGVEAAAPGAGGGRRRGGAFGAAFLPDAAELINCDMAALHMWERKCGGSKILGACWKDD
jgi:hypothetical protein